MGGSVPGTCLLSIPQRDRLEDMAIVSGGTGRRGWRTGWDQLYTQD